MSDDDFFDNRGNDPVWIDESKIFAGESSSGLGDSSFKRVNAGSNPVSPTNQGDDMAVMPTDGFVFVGGLGYQAQRFALSYRVGDLARIDATLVVEDSKPLMKMVKEQPRGMLIEFENIRAYGDIVSMSSTLDNPYLVNVQFILSERNNKVDYRQEGSQKTELVPEPLVSGRKVVLD